MVIFMNKILIISIVMLISACVTRPDTVYQALGGYSKIEEIVEYYIDEIEHDPIVFEYFKESDVERYRTKITEHFCYHTGGPCEYTGDTIEKVHDGMNMSESDFNRGVDLLINSMNRANIPHRVQNRVLAIFAPMRKEIIYRK